MKRTDCRIELKETSKSDSLNAPKVEESLRKFTGVVSSKKDVGGKLISTRLIIFPWDEIHISLNRKGKELGEILTNEMVEVVGKMKMIGREKWMTVTSFHIILNTIEDETQFLPAISDSLLGNVSGEENIEFVRFHPNQSSPETLSEFRTGPGHY